MGHTEGQETRVGLQDSWDTDMLFQVWFSAGEGLEVLPRAVQPSLTLA